MFDGEAMTQYHNLKPGRYINLIVGDNGQGISQEDIDCIFDLYFTTKEVGRGTGMGLAVVHGIVKEHNGLITVESELGKGTTFSIFFPVVEEEAVVETETDETLPTGNERILFIRLSLGCINNKNPGPSMIPHCGGGPGFQCNNIHPRFFSYNLPWQPVTANKQFSDVRI